MVANLTTCCFAGFGTKRLRCDDTMKTPERGTLNRWATTLSNRAHGCGRSEQILLKHVGCEPRKDPAAGGVFFLTSPFIELTRTWRLLRAVGSGLMNGCFPDACVLIEPFVRDAVKHDRAVIQPFQIVSLVFTLCFACARR